MIDHYIGILHLFGMVLENIYGYIVPKDLLLDKIYMFIFVSIVFSWLLLKDECAISYAVKKYKDANYILGSEPENITDITDLFYNPDLYYVFYYTNHLLRIGSLVIVNKRTTHVKEHVFYPTLVLYSFYTYDITYKTNYRKKFYPYFQILFCFYLLQLMVYPIINRWVHRYD
jgi:hypothetical protein